MIRDEEESGMGMMQNESEEGLLVLHVGKWTVRIRPLIDDEKFESMNLAPAQLWRDVKPSMRADRQRS